ncbi:LysR substrate-binding domain-containing protein [Rhizobium sp. BK376]|uniref:LysR substrate-binding domain-containing protein n=1 Tax=Rhizobium sp. BK376 TaxID=2512149 RepID=UPI00104C0D27|nr:LysR substrate-binding domain-containing protein [Rhizobium sp. BK376]TCR89790.1 LysR family transcriptional regulator [Rhizobium sp. BK376]
MVDIRQMRYFIALAETLHFGRAADRLNITQPPLSRQVGALERELGVKLLERHSRRAVLTAAGQQFLEDARSVVSSFDQACRNVRLADRGELGELSIGFMMHAAHTVLPGLAKRYMAAFPLVEVKLREVIPSSLSGDVVAGRFDAGITFSPGPVRGLATYPVHRENLCLAIHREHEFAAHDVIGAAALEGQPLIATPVDVAPTLRQAISDYCRPYGFEPTIRLETQLQQTIISLVGENLGIALVPQSMAKLQTRDVVFRALEDAPAIEQVIAWRPQNLNPALRAFLTVAEVPKATMQLD